MRTVIYQLHRTGGETVRQHFYCVLAVFCEHDDTVFRCKDKIVVVKPERPRESQGQSELQPNFAVREEV